MPSGFIRIAVPCVRCAAGERPTLRRDTQEWVHAALVRGKFSSTICAGRHPVRRARKTNERASA
jgi:hypothetical protein